MFSKDQEVSKQTCHGVVTLKGSTVELKLDQIRWAIIGTNIQQKILTTEVWLRWSQIASALRHLEKQIPSGGQ